MGRDGRGSTYAVHPAANPERVYDPPPEVADSDNCVVVEFLGDDGEGNAGAVVRFLAGLPIPRAVPQQLTAAQVGSFLLHRIDVVGAATAWMELGVLPAAAPTAGTA